MSQDIGDNGPDRPAVEAVLDTSVLFTMVVYGIFRWAVHDGLTWLPGASSDWTCSTRSINDSWVAVRLRVLGVGSDELGEEEQKAGCGDEGETSGQQERPLGTDAPHPARDRAEEERGLNATVSTV